MELKQLYLKFRTHPEGTWIMQWANAQRLYNFILNNPIKRVLGLGTGVGLSDAVVALAWLHKKETDCHLDSIEQYDKCIKLANELIPEDLKSFIEIHKSEPKVWESDKMPYNPTSIYEMELSGDYDLIINDGPSPFMLNNNYLDLPNGTIHKMILEGKIKAGTKIIYDGRVTSLKLLERYLGDNLSLIFLPPVGEDFVVLERNDKPLVVRDDKLDAMKSQTLYFKNHENTISSDQQSPSSETADTSEGAKK
jgi:hypothetical protein